MRFSGVEGRGRCAIAIGVFTLYACFTLLSVFKLPFPTGFDELQHFSVIKAQAAQPEIFPDLSHYRVVSPTHLDQWSAEGNYINHPSFYYLLLSPFYGADEDVVTRLRLVNAAFSLMAAGLLLSTATCLAVSRSEAAMLCCMLVAFPKACTVGGMINNDNLAGIAGALFFYGLAVSSRRSMLFLCMSLILAGLTKLTALISLSLVVVVYRYLLARERPFSLCRDDLYLAVSLLIASIPYLHNLFSFGHLLWVNQAHFTAVPSAAPPMHFGEYVWYFFQHLAQKWQAIEGLFFMGPVLLVLFVLQFFGLYGARNYAFTRLAVAYFLAFCGTLLLHLFYGWQAYQQLGDLTIAQMRYYNVLWPGLCLGVFLGARQLNGYFGGRPVGSVLTLCLILLPTLPVALAYSLLINR